MFESYPTYNPYRALQLTDPLMKGEDVYALQCALNFVLGLSISKDGVFGRKETAPAVFSAQKAFKIEEDGVAGQVTQKRLALRIAHHVRLQNQLPEKLLYGQIAHESSFLLGNYSKQRNSGSFDAGVVQRNSEHHPVKDAFDPVNSIKLLGRHVRASYDDYSGVSDKRRRWGLAAGSWNAPAFTAYLAGETDNKAEPGPASRVLIEAYITSVTAYMIL